MLCVLRRGEGATHHAISNSKISSLQTWKKVRTCRTCNIYFPPRTSSLLLPHHPLFHSIRASIASFICTPIHSNSTTFDAVHYASHLWYSHWPRCYRCSLPHRPEIQAHFLQCHAQSHSNPFSRWGWKLAHWMHQGKQVFLLPESRRPHWSLPGLRCSQCFFHSFDVLRLQHQS